MKISRALFSVTLVAVLGGTVAGCGSSVIPSGDEAHTMACRGYVLTVGDDDKTHVADLISDASNQGDDITSDPILGKMRTAAATAGSAAGLADDDFARFRAVVEGVDALAASTKVLDDGTTMSTSATSLVRLSKAVAAVHKLCY